ncbi:spermidine/putrescine ABC transporter substrate-binding protein [Candidatus Riesia sp. GBBU]|nr:spermidine/putrescine ABC transporter substrate-binding protein [Candidatus Riesia sp. GBBU]
MIFFKIFFFITYSISLANKEEKIIRFYNWSEYVSSEVLNQFTKETGIKVICSTYSSNESMYSKIKIYKKESYDLIVPSTYFIEKMSKEGMLKKIDKTKLTQFRNIDINFLNKSFDPKNNFSIPYIWGATGIGVNTDFINPNRINSWANLWDQKYRKKLLLIDDAREIFQMALLKLGCSGNTSDPKLIKMAYEELKKIVPNIMAFNSDNPANPFIQGEAEIGMIWNGSASIARRFGVPIEFIWPKEGGIFWMDSLAIPSTSKNVNESLRLIDFLLRPDIAEKIIKKIGYPTANFAAKKLLPKRITNNKILYPDKEIINNGEWQKDVGKANILYENYFQKLKSVR